MPEKLHKLAALHQLKEGMSDLEKHINNGSNAVIIQLSNDTGKAQVPVEILDKPEKLADEEFALLNDTQRAKLSRHNDVPRPWITCSSASVPSRASSLTVGFA